VKRHFILAWNE